ncbi:hypothetical protein UFOVP122_39 [uncultured Caudovirales phage]|uniref:Uncharacterized protein n=1 Tax=uncultured Caudovirales phage TaxID=2100421 RepID=A0A6J5L8T7_9CAUD|nr:hypothetical protein UFOVP122_39 [uncultured Caudovirales phage]
MAVRYVKDFEFPSAAGYTKSTPSKVTGQMYAKGGHVKKNYFDGGGVDATGMGGGDPTQAAQGMPQLTPQQKQQLMMAQAAKRRAMMAQQAQQSAAQPMPGADPSASPLALKKGGMAQKVQMAKSNAIESSLKGQKKTGYAEGGKAVKVPLPAEDEAPYPSQWPMPSDDQINKENWNQRKAIRRAMGAKNTGKDTFAKGGKVHDDAAEDKKMIKSMIKPSALKKADGGITPPQIASPLQMMGKARSVPVAPRGPMIPQQGAPAGGVGVNKARPGQPNVGAIRAAMAKKASMAAPENAPSMMKKGGKVGC